MSAISGIPTKSQWGGETSLPWTDRLTRTQTISVSKAASENGPPQWLTNLGQYLLAALFTILSMPLMVIGGITAAAVTAWALLLPALAAGLVVVLMSFIITAF
jgi:hypothetical protein